MRGMQFAGGLSALLFGLLCTPGISHGASIKGKVVFAGPVPAQKKVDVTIDQYLCGTQKDAGDLLLSPQKELRNAVVWLENPPAGTGAPAESAKVEMDQNGCMFIPRVETLVEVEPQEVLTLKGFRRPVIAYRVRGLKTPQS
jgi:hypothetical protein